MAIFSPLSDIHGMIKDYTRPGGRMKSPGRIFSGAGSPSTEDEAARD
jgi:hypothetical protein